MFWPVGGVYRADDEVRRGVLVGGGAVPRLSRTGGDLLCCGRLGDFASERCRVMVIAPGELLGAAAGARLQHQLSRTRRRGQILARDDDRGFRHCGGQDRPGSPDARSSAS